MQVAVAKLEEAKILEDQMSYMEPPRLYQPIRHCLGYVLSNITQDHVRAEQVCHKLLKMPTRGLQLQMLTMHGRLAFGCAAHICAIQPIVQQMHACAECAGV